MDGGAANHGRNRRSNPRPTNKGSKLLTEQENEILFSLLGKSNYSLAAGVAQFLAADMNPRAWNKKCSGVVCLVKDYAQRAYFLRLYDLQSHTMSWEQMLYDNFQVKAPCTVLLTFEGDHCVCGLNFSSAEEAKAFKTQLDKKYDNEQKQTGETAATADFPGRKAQAPSRPAGPPLGQRQADMGSGGVGYGGVPGTNTTEMGIAAPMPSTDQNSGKPRKKAKENKKKTPKLTKDQIGLPTNFVHKAHIGWNPAEGFKASGNDGNDFDSTVAELVRKIGYDPDSMSPTDRKLVYDVIAQQGGMEVAKEEVKRMSIAPPHMASAPSFPPQPPPPSHSYPSPPSYPTPQRPYHQNGGPPARPAHSPAVSKAPAPPPPPPRDAPKPHAPPPPPGRPLPNPPSSAPRPSGGPPPPPPPPGPGRGGFPAAGGGPPPPPPPPPPGDLKPNPQTVGATAPPQAGRGDLLAAIRQGTQLKSVNKEEQSGSDRASGGGDGKTALNRAIEKGVNLKHVEAPAGNRTTPPENMGGIAGALARALAERRGQIHASDDDEDGEESVEDDDEWSD